MDFAAFLDHLAAPEELPLRPAVERAHDAIEGFWKEVEQHVAALEKLATDCEAGRRPLPEVLRALAERCDKVRERALSVADRLGLEGRAMVQREANLLGCWERYQELFRDTCEPRRADLELAHDLERKFLAALADSSSLRESEKAFLRRQTEASLALQASAGVFSLQEAERERAEERGDLEKLEKIGLDQAVQAARYPETWWRGLHSDAAKQALLAQLQPFFEDVVSFLLETHHVEQALVVSETARARAFADLLRGREEIRKRLEAGRLARKNVVPSPTTVEPPTLPEILGFVHTWGCVTIEYFLSEKRLAAWVVSPEGRIETLSQPVDRLRVEAMVRGLEAFLFASEEPAGQSEEVHRRLRELYDLLIRPLAAWLPSGEEITVIPHGALFQIPFAALCDENGRFLIEKHPLLYGVSLSVLRDLSPSREIAEPPGPMLALVDPEPLPPGLDGEILASLGLLRRGFVETIVPFYHQREVLLGRDATREALQKKGPNAAVLHLATHAQYAPQDPLASFIALAHEGAEEDGRLNVLDLFELDLDADLALLWACETGKGRITADGVEGLSRGFAWAGASSLLLALWEIPETDTLTLIELFHEAWLHDRTSKARALQRAQAAYSRLYPAQPGLWAGLVLYGRR
jgi:CHAT domain-containing protein